MKSFIFSVALGLSSLIPACSFAEGFGLIEFTAEGIAMGGAAMFIREDSGNIAYNPAGITLCTGEQIKSNITCISPVAKYVTFDQNNNITGSGKNSIHPAWVPGIYYARKVNAKEWYGLALFSRFGNMSEFESGTIAATNNRFAKVLGLSITPTYSRKSGRKFYWALGGDINYAGLELQKDLTAFNPDLGRNKTKGKSWALGWNAGLRYAATDNDEFGFAYRSKISHSLDADFDWYNRTGKDLHSHAHGKVILPDSYHLGYSHKFDAKNRIEIGAIRTQWHNFKELALDIDGIGHTSSLHNWRDNNRYAVGLEHSFSKKYTGMLGFSLDDGCIPYNGGDFMIPMGLRRTYSIGAKYHDFKQTLAVSVAYMTLGDLSFAGGATDAYASAHSHNNSTKIFSIGYTYRF